MKNEKPLKDRELLILSELMKNSKQSDREIAAKLGISQPTVSRIRYKLEKEGYIRQYTVVPNLQKLGYQLVVITFVKFKEDMPKEDAEKFRKRAREVFREETYAPNVAMFERGMGLGASGVIVSYHKNYRSYAQSLRIIKGYGMLDTDVKSFIIDLNDPVHYRHLTFAPMAHDILKVKKEREQE